MSKYILFLILLDNIRCINERSRAKHAATIKIADNLFKERFTVFGSGAFGGDLEAVYLTDSIHFRIYIGTEDYPNKYFNINCMGDSIIIQKLKIDEENSRQKALEKKFYLKHKLIEENKFE
jgi:hypothetical protein